MKIRITGKLKRAAVGIYNTVTPADQDMNANFAADNAAEIAAQNRPKTEAEKLAASGIGPTQQSGPALGMNQTTTPMSNLDKFKMGMNKRVDNVMSETFGNPWSLYNMAGFASNIVDGINNRRDMKNAARKERDFYSTTGGMFAESDPELTSRGIRAVSGTMRNKDFPNQISGNTSFQGMMQNYYNPYRAALGLSVDNVYAPGAALAEFTPGVDPLAPSFAAGAGPTPAPDTKNPMMFDSGLEDMEFREMIAAKESKGRGGYKALPYDSKGHLVSSAAGKYQFLWNQHAPWITKVTGVESKQEFLNNPQAQELAFDYWEKNTLTPAALKIKNELGVNDSLNKIKARVHFAGPKGAYDFYAYGKETVDAFNTKTSTYADGGETINPMKIRITGTPDMPSMAYGGQSNYGLDLGQRKVYSDMQQPFTESISNVMTEKDPEDLDPDEQYAIMAEDKETVVSDMDGDGGLEFKQISGDPHSAASGGTKLTNKQLNPNPDKNGEGAFIYSHKLKVKDPEVLKKFGVNKNKASFAEMSKRFDTTNEKKVLDNPNADFLDKRTANLGKQYKEQKLQMLADYQEAIKGNPQGRPDINKSLATAAYGGYFPMADVGMQIPDPPPGYRQRTPFLNDERERADFQSVEDLNRFYSRQGYTGGANIGNWQKWMVEQARKDPFYRNRLTSYLQSVPLTNKGRNLYGQDADRSKLSEDQLYEQFQDGLWDFRAPKVYKPVTTDMPPPRSITPVPVPTTLNIKPPMITPPARTTPGQPVQKPTDPYLPYNGIQMANTLYAASRPIKGYFDRPFVPEYTGAQAVFDEPNYDPLLSANATRQDFMNQFGNAQAARASGAYNPDLIQGLVGETDRTRRNNLEIANRTLSQNNMMYNQNNMLRAREMDTVRENNIRTREQMDIAKDLKYNDTMKNFGKMVNDRTTMERFNLMYPQFATTGRLWDKTQFTKGRPLGSAASSSGTGSALPSMQEWLKSRPGMAKMYAQANPEKQMEIEKAYDQDLRSQKAMFMRSGNNVGQNMMNPYMMDLF